MRDLSERDGEKIQDPESGGRKYRIECATHPEKSVESMAVAIPSNMASRGPTRNYCMVQNPSTKWQYRSPDIIHLLIG